MTDTLALSVLAVVAGSVASDARPIGVLLEVVVGLVILALFCAFVLPRVTRWVFAGVGQHRGARFLFVVVALTAAALVADRAGIEGIVGAFFAGLALNRLVPARSRLMEQIEFVGGVLLIPFFLLSTGMLIDPGRSPRGGVIAIACLSLAIVFVGKGAAALLSARVLGLRRPQTRLLFGLSLAQAAATLAAVTIGVEIGLFDTDLLNATLVVVLVTVLVSSIVTRTAARRIEPPAVQGERLAENVFVPVDVVDDPEVVELAARLAMAKGATSWSVLSRRSGRRWTRCARRGGGGTARYRDGRGGVVGRPRRRVGGVRDRGHRGRTRRTLMVTGWRELRSPRISSSVGRTSTSSRSRTSRCADTLGRRVSFLLSVSVLRDLDAPLRRPGPGRRGRRRRSRSSRSGSVLGYTFYSGAMEAWRRRRAACDELSGARPGVRARAADHRRRDARRDDRRRPPGPDRPLPSRTRPVRAPPGCVRRCVLRHARHRFRATACHAPRSFPARVVHNASAGVEFGWRQRPPAAHARVGRQLGFFMWGFYAAAALPPRPPRHDAVWIAGLVTAGIALSTIVGNQIVNVASRYCRKRTTLLLAAGAVQTIAAIAVGLAGSFWVALAALLVMTAGR